LKEARITFEKKKLRRLSERVRWKKGAEKRVGGVWIRTGVLVFLFTVLLFFFQKGIIPESNVCTTIRGSF